MNFPIPVFVTPRPPNIWTASRAVSCPHRVLWLFRNAIWLRQTTNQQGQHECWLNHHVPSKFIRLDLVVHVVHLVGDVLKPRLHALRACDHTCQLAADDSKLMQRFASKSFTLGDPPTRGDLWVQVMVSTSLMTHFMHSSTIDRCPLAEAQHITHRSWLKLLKITKIPPPSGPRVFSIGTLTLSKVIKAVPAVDE